MRLLSTLLLSLAAGLASLGAEPLGNFKFTGFTYGYEKWADLKAVQKVDKEGVTVSGPADGGAGIFLYEGLDLGVLEAIELTLKLAPGNDVDSVLLKIPNVQEWRVDLSKAAADKFTTIRLPLSAAARAANAEAKNVQLQGTFTPGRTVAITIASINLVIAK